jgi:4-phytase / acid phosphatase
LPKFELKRGSIFLLLIACLPFQGVTAQDRPSAGLQRSDRLRMVVILSRHGVRSPTWTQDRLNSYSAQPWPTWSVPPANLTPRGHELLMKFGRFDRTWLTASGLLPSSGCAEASSIYLWADTAQRTTESARALAEGLLPGCWIPVHGLPEGAGDPLFHPAAAGVTTAQADTVLAALSARLEQPQDPEIDRLVTEMRHLLSGCNLQLACVPSADPAMELPSSRPVAMHESGDRLADINGPLPMASSFIEDLLLEYAEGLPWPQVGWGRVDETQLRELLALHTAYFDLIHRTPAIARIEASNLLFHITRTLEQGEQGKSIAGAVGPAGEKVVVLVGHDTNLASLAALLGMHWYLDGRKDDTPPGTEMRFELWQDANGAYSVRMVAAMQTLHQLRSLSDLTLRAPPANSVLALSGTNRMESDVPWSEFQHIADSLIEREFVIPMKVQ